jgi:RNA polymerase sigma-70 factor (ECF subfamily)
VSDEEAALVRRCLHGDANAIGDLVGRYQGPVYGLCVRLLQDRHEAEDVSQEVFLRVFRSLKRWDPTRPLKPWIMGITVNRCRTCLAQRQRQPELAPYLQDTAPGKPAEDTAELAAEIRIAVDSLRVDYRTAFVLYHEHGQAYDDIAEAMAKPVGTIKTWLHRARLEVLDYLRRRGMVSEVRHELP